MIHSLVRKPVACMAAYLLSTSLPGPAAAQDAALALNAGEISAAAGAVASAANGGTGSALARGRFAVVIDLDRNRLFFKQGEITLWSAPVGTGTGLRLRTDEKEWRFSTPRGIFHVQYKEQNPVWNAPDWYFVENGLPVPPVGDPKRRFPGGLGAAAVYIGRDLAIHGTNRPELLGQRVSHGCIRLSNKDALRLYHNVQVGTEVVIVGGDDVPEEVVTPEQVMAEKARATFDPARPAPRDAVLEGWKALPTEELLLAFDDELSLRSERSRWAEVAGLLLDRGLRGKDDAALTGLLSRTGEFPDEAREREYGTFLADAFGRSPLRTLAMLSRLDREKRAPAGRVIVEATMNLFHGAFDASGAPWPTLRIPRDVVTPEARIGWLALADAEREFRTR
jgi:hypothetical protein